MRKIRRLLFLPIFFLLFVSFAFAAHIYVDVSCTYNGDGTTASCASSDGGAGAYNNLSDPLANATAGDIIWLRRGNSNISVSSTLSPANDGTESNPIKLVGWPYYEQVSGTVDGPISGKEKFGFYDAELTATDKGHYCSAEIEFTSGNNSGLKRKIIFYQYDSGNSRGEVYVFPDLPNNIAAGDNYTITLKTEEYDNRPQAGIDAGWDNDDYVRPVLDGGNGDFKILDFTYDYFWAVYNLVVTNVTDIGIYIPSYLKNIIGYNLRAIASIRYYPLEYIDIYGWNTTSDYDAIDITDCFALLEHVHLQGHESEYASAIGPATGGVKLKNCSFGLVVSFNTAFKGPFRIEGESVSVNATTITDDVSAAGETYVKLSGYNCDPTKFHQWYYQGEIYNVDEDATIDPPSGATTYIKLVPNSHCNSIYPLIYENHRNVSSGSKTYTWKFRPTGWSSLSTSDVEIEAWFLEESSGAKRKYGSANPSAVTNDTWNDLQITFNPGQEGVVYFKIKLKKYESGAWIAIDPKPNAS